MRLADFMRAFGAFVQLEQLMWRGGRYGMVNRMDIFDTCHLLFNAAETLKARTTCTTLLQYLQGFTEPRSASMVAVALAEIRETFVEETGNATIS